MNKIVNRRFDYYIKVRGYQPLVRKKIFTYNIACNPFNKNVKHKYNNTHKRLGFLKLCRSAR